ncbi:MAG: Eco57I restriction-modification methylase domain-containing protein [Clostridiaceae bacterium]
MEKIFLDDIESVNKLINNPIDSMFKLTAINNLKYKHNIDNNSYIGGYLNDILADKKNGTVYTPKDIADYIIKNTITKDDIVNNPFIKILDPSCGCGNILIPIFTYIKSIYEENIEEINAINSLDLDKNSINKHILDNNIFGFDIDGFALNLFKIDIFSIACYINSENIIKQDFLKEEESTKFDIIIGNPPYIGHKTISRDYSSYLKNNFKDVYKDKGDISYCFFKKALVKLKDEGKVTFITSRYFIESPSGEGLRNYLVEKSIITKIVDFYGIRPFKGKGIDSAIIFLVNTKNNKETTRIIRPKNYNKNDFLKSLINNEEDKIKIYNVNINLLDCSGWSLIDDISYNIVNKIKKKSSKNLGELCNSNQGIITGLDKAFIVSEETIDCENLEEDIIRPWIKSSNISKNFLYRGNKYLIYSNHIKEEQQYPNIIKHLLEYKDRLNKRRECVKGYRKWYELQWGRVEDNFKDEKIIFPYKASENRFFLDSGSFYSADIYSLKIKDGININYEYLQKLLNSKVYEFYFKTYGKKLGNTMYEYYPSYVERLAIPIDERFVIDNENNIYEYFQFNREEINLIENE